MTIWPTALKTGRVKNALPSLTIQVPTTSQLLLHGIKASILMTGDLAPEL